MKPGDSCGYYTSGSAGWHGPDVTGTLTLTWDGLDAEAWREVVALLVERVDALGLGDYRMTWSAAGRSLAGVLLGVDRGVERHPHEPAEEPYKL
jgi:hypothetical protein